MLWLRGDIALSCSSTKNVLDLGRAMRKRVFGAYADIAGPDPTAHLHILIRGLRCPQKESVDTTEYFSGEQMPG